MDILLAVLVFFVGASVGSFLSVLTARLGRKEGIVTGRSQCPRCGTVLAWYDLIPVVSFIILRRRCRRCKAPISWMYVAMELVSGLSLSALFVRQGFTITPETAFLALMLVGFLALFFFDYKYFLLPDRITIPLIAIALGYRIVASSDLLMNTVLTGFFLALVFAILYVLSGGAWIGFGDVKLMVLLGLVFGYPAGLLVVVLAIWSAAIVGIGLLVTGKGTSQTALPFGSFLAAVAVITVIFYHESSIITKLFF